ncbi:hypothetical protein CA13_64990 [Planctomycetes bacterium CA13]|uniref:Uncharacterized protein n=1 Tax=Novipirellula herctigrandis TaxID=2527986 RepID=A0A5C5ZD73_9BACT|nr:hypothetical protein CA13_64990 [Planctomycetes bacterium CA13]
MISGVSIVDSADEIKWKRTEHGLVITTPLRAPNEIAICYRIETNGWSPLTTNNQ